MDDDAFEELELRLLLLLLLMPLLQPLTPLPTPLPQLWGQGPSADLQQRRFLLLPFVDDDPVVVMALSPDDSIASSKMRNEFSVELVGKLISDNDDESKLALGETRK